MISGLILAAGSSSRLGRPKQLLDLNGKPLLQVVIDSVAAAGLGEIVVVLGRERAAIEEALVLPSNARVVDNPDHAMGQSTSLRAGLEALATDSEACLIVLGDQPGVTARHLRVALDAFLVEHAPVVRASWSGIPGHPVVAGRALWADLLTAEGDKGARDIIALTPGLIEVQMDEPPPADIDTMEDYQRLIEGSD